MPRLTCSWFNLKGGDGPLFAYDLSDGSQRYTLPGGLRSADGRQYFAAVQTGADTLLDQFVLATGAAKLRARLAGRWGLGGLSPNGRWLAATRLPASGETQRWAAKNQWQTDLQILDMHTGQAAHQISLDGNFDVDTLSSSGDALFLIQHLPAVNPEHYQVRLYNLVNETLQPGALVDKRAADEVMAGQRWQAVASPDGTWLFTLYLRAKNDTAFIHALTLPGEFTLCIDLPSGSAIREQLQAYSLALAPDGQALYAANPALGLVARVSLSDFSAAPVAQFQVAPRNTYDSDTPGRSVVSADGRNLYFTNGSNVWAYRIQTETIASYGLSAAITGLGVSRDGRRLYLARSGQPLVALDTLSGETLDLQAAGASGL